MSATRRPGGDLDEPFLVGHRVEQERVRRADQPRRGFERPHALQDQFVRGRSLGSVRSRSSIRASPTRDQAGRRECFGEVTNAAAGLEAKVAG